VRAVIQPAGLPASPAISPVAGIPAGHMD